MFHGAQVPCLLCHRALGGEALYRVVGTAAGSVEVEVVSAPGLDPGTRVRFTEDAVARMSVVEADAAQRAQPRGEADPSGQDGRLGDAVVPSGG